MTIMDTLKQKNPELYDRLMRLGTMGEREGAWDDEAYYQYGLAKDVDVPRGQSVGPYDVYVASSPISRLAGGVEKGMHLGRMSEALNRRRGLADETAQTRGDVAQEALMAGSNLGGSAAGMPEPGAPMPPAPPPGMAPPPAFGTTPSGYETGPGQAQSFPMGSNPAGSTLQTQPQLNSMQDLERLRATDPQLASEIEQFMRASGGTFGG